MANLRNGAVMNDGLFAHKAQKMPVHGAVMVLAALQRGRRTSATRSCAWPLRKRRMYQQMVTALPDRGTGPLRIGPAQDLLRVAWKRDGRVMV